MDNVPSKIAVGSLLVVDDDLHLQQALEALLSSAGYKVRCAPSGEVALILATEDPPDLILLDVQLQDMDGFEIYRRLCEDLRTDIPVIFIGAMYETVDKVSGFATGGMDCIPKPYRDEEVLARVTLHLELKRTKADLQEHVAKQTAVVQERLRFEQLLVDISARLANLPPDQVDLEVERGLGQVLRFFQVDRCGLVRVLHDKNTFQVTHIAYAEDVPAVPKGVELPLSLHPWAYDKLFRKREVLAFSRVDDLPDEADIDKKTWVDWGIRSHLNIPLAIGGLVDHMISISTFRNEFSWPEEYIPRLRVLGETFINTLWRIENRLQLEDQLRFERLLAEISGRFVNLPADQVDNEIEAAQRRICECLELDVSSLWQWSKENPRIGKMTHIYKPVEFPPLPEPMYAHEQFPWCQKELEAGRTIVVSSIEDVPAEAARDQEVWRQLGVKTSLTFPLTTGGGPIIGALSFNTIGQERTWPESVIQQLRLIAEIFTSALARKQAEKALRESEERLRVATHAAGAGLWIMEPDTGHVWVTPKSRELFHFDPDEKLTYDSYFRVIHPDDHAQVHQAVKQTLESGVDLRCDYRIVLPDGRIRWIGAFGKLHLRSAEESDRLMGVSLDITERKQMEEQLKKHLNEIEELKQRLEKENVYLQQEIKLLVEHTDIVGQSAAMKMVLSQAEQVAQTESTVLLLGETGTGKELLARAIHSLSSRKNRPLVTVNCAALAPTLIESELFGREKGAYTGALTRMVGRFEIADGSSLFLDEIGELPLDLQSKLLRVLEEGRFERLGSTKPLHVDVRIIAATNRDIEQEVKEGKFRRDLFYRLNVFPIVIPPLRERLEDIPLLIRAIVREFQKRMGKEIESIPKKTIQALQSYSWPGNVRELRNIIEHAMILSKGKYLEIQVPKRAHAETDPAGNLKDMERRHIVAVLEKTGWRISGPDGAAEVLGLKRTTLLSKMKKLGIKRSDKEMSK